MCRVCSWSYSESRRGGRFAVLSVAFRGNAGETSEHLGSRAALCLFRLPSAPWSRALVRDVVSSAMGERADYWLARWHEAGEIIAAYHRIERARLDNAERLARMPWRRIVSDQWSRVGLARLISRRDANQDGDTSSEDRQP